MKKKLIVIICATLALAVTLCACQDTNVSVPTPTQTPTTSATDDTTTPVPDPEPVPTPVSDPFINETNYVNASVGSVTILPKHVYWEDGKLVAVCFICNGTENTIYNLEVESLAFNGNTGALANGAFGLCQGLSLAPMTHTEWTFTFGEDCVAQYGADLSRLNTQSSTRYSY